MAGDYWAHVREFSRSARLFLAAATLGGVSGGVTNLLLNLYIVSLGYPERALPGFARFGLAGAAAGAIAGGCIAYLIGAQAFESVGRPILSAFSPMPRISRLFPSESLPSFSVRCCRRFRRAGH